ncbi:mobile mystery protein B [Corynebacterium renale]|uniref:Fic family protein n=1 Tax=Corynebacterium renale TaxID=1724 RepID=UPI000DA29D90|nr:Fic family protein [Corynebacterium renale]SQG63709.1 mobile mystery protein B [Corynebacterium renale]STD01715.1 mobile mystery protein B [Corynebacterium renale]
MLLTGSLVLVLYSAGKVFDNLRSGRLAAEAFLRSGQTTGIASRADLQLLEDLKAAGYLVAQAKREGAILSADLVCEINGAMTRSAALHPGQLRTDEQQIGVRTSYGSHMPPALTMDGVREVVDKHKNTHNREGAARLFGELAKAQPFEDGNKRTALLAANVLLPGDATLVVPFDADGAGDVESTFHDLLARAYIFDETEPVARYMCRWAQPA